jgi:hypothetical protein
MSLSEAIREIDEAFIIEAKPLEEKEEYFFQQALAMQKG